MSSEFIQRVGDVSVGEEKVSYTPVGGMHINYAIKHIQVFQEKYQKPVIVTWQSEKTKIPLEMEGGEIYRRLVVENLEDL